MATRLVVPKTLSVVVKSVTHWVAFPHHPEVRDSLTDLLWEKVNDDICFPVEERVYDLVTMPVREQLRDKLFSGKAVGY